MRFKKRFVFPGVVVIVILMLVLFFKPYYNFLTREVGISPFKTLFSQDSIRKVDEEVNILILGIPGGAHDGPYLSDTIIFANYNLRKNRVVTVSIPRDVWSDTLQDKVNSAYSYGEQKQEDGGIRLAKAEVSAIMGMPIQYAVVVNFSGFKNIIDFVGGVDVDVKRAFTDNKFPIEGRENDECGGDRQYLCRYETVTFKRGIQHMDGERALKFVRSRNARGDEGSDFARGQRQQIVIEALYDNILTAIKSLDLARIRKLYRELNKTIDRDISNQQIAILARRIVFDRGFYKKNFHLTHDMFEVPDVRQYYGKYVLIPRDGSFADIHRYIKCLIDQESAAKCSSLVEKGE